MSVSSYIHYKKYLDREIEFTKGNILLCGPTGTGKTFTVQTLADKLNLPFINEDITSYTASGYVGNSVTKLIYSLIIAANGDMDKAEHGIIYIDEVDKIARMNSKGGSSKDVSGECVQQELLKIIEGTDIFINPKQLPCDIKSKDKNFKFSTRNILFVFGGAFVGLEEIIDKRTTDTTIGFLKTNKNNNVTKHKKIPLLRRVTVEDFVEFGLLPEFIGRISATCTLDHLEARDLENILTNKPHSPLKQYKELFSKENITLEFTNQAIHTICQKAVKSNTGARALKSIVDKVMVNALFNYKKIKGVNTIRITKTHVTDKETLPEFIKK